MSNSVLYSESSDDLRDAGMRDARRDIESGLDRVDRRLSRGYRHAELRARYAYEYVNDVEMEGSES